MLIPYKAKTTIFQAWEAMNPHSYKAFSFPDDRNMKKISKAVASTMGRGEVRN